MRRPYFLAKLITSKPSGSRAFQFGVCTRRLYPCHGHFRSTFCRNDAIVLLIGFTNVLQLLDEEFVTSERVLSLFLLRAVQFRSSQDRKSTRLNSSHPS